MMVLRNIQGRLSNYVVNSFKFNIQPLLRLHSRLPISLHSRLPIRTIHSRRTFTTRGNTNYGHGRRGQLILPLSAGLAYSIYTMTVCEADEHQEREAGCREKVQRIEIAVQVARSIAMRKMVECGCPGMSVAVSVDGNLVWTEGFGYADVENDVPCRPETVFRVASISKPITVAAAARLVDQGVLDLDQDVNLYLPDFPVKRVDGEEVNITVRQLLSHMAGIRHYDKTYIKPKDVIDSDGKQTNEFALQEYYIKEHYNTVNESLTLFKDDPLVHKPGTKFLYTSHGFTLASAVIEKAAGQSFSVYLKKVLDELGLEHTYMEDHSAIIPHRGRHYVKDDKGRLKNVPYVDLSYKWAGGGLISNVKDLCQFGNVMLYSYQFHSPSETGLRHPSNQGKLLPYLKPETVNSMWTKMDKTEAEWDGMTEGGYGLGWAVWPQQEHYAYCKSLNFFVSHTGGAIGASSVLLILPGEGRDGQTDVSVERTGLCFSKGVVVSMITNMTSVGLNKTAHQIAKVFGEM